MKIHVMHVPGIDPRRDAIVAGLQDQAEVCLHADPGRAGCMATWLRALGCAAARDTHLEWSTIINDDIEALPGWQEELALAQRFCPTPVLGLTHFAGFGAEALRHGCPYGVGPHLVWGGAITYQREVLRGLYSWCSAVVAETDFPHDDWLIMAYAARSGFLTAMTARAIFDLPNIKSLLGHTLPLRTPNFTIRDEGPPWDAEPRAWPVRRDVPPRVAQMTQYQIKEAVT